MNSWANFVLPYIALSIFCLDNSFLLNSRIVLRVFEHVQIEKLSSSLRDDYLFYSRQCDGLLHYDEVFDLQNVPLLFGEYPFLYLTELCTHFCNEQFLLSNNNDLDQNDKINDIFENKIIFV